MQRVTIDDLVFAAVQIISLFHPQKLLKKAISFAILLITIHVVFKFISKASVSRRVAWNERLRDSRVRSVRSCREDRVAARVG